MTNTKELSYMLAVPCRIGLLDSPDEILDRLSQSPHFRLKAHKRGAASVELTLESGGDEYHAEIFPSGFEIPELYRVQHFFPDVDADELGRINEALAVHMEFGADALASYHLQLRVIHAILPRKLAVLDSSSEKILSGRWAGLAAEAQTPPAPRYLYTVQAVSGEDETIWLHSHGLNRCGLPELEILNSSRDTYQSHYSVIETMANRMLEREEPLDPGEPLYLARLTQDVELVTTLLPWEEAVRFYDDKMLGGKNDREGSHNGNTCAIFVYKSQEDYENRRFSPVSLYDELWEQNPIYLLTTSETNRMRALAAERLSYMKRAFSDPSNKILVKLGLEMDEEHRTDNNSLEHIWFELLGVEGGIIRARLTQEPYYISGLHAEDEGEYSCGRITDWLIFTPERRVTPDDVYLLELKNEKV